MLIDKYTQEYNRKTVDSLPDKTNTYLPISAGVESTAALLYCMNDPDIHPFCVSWYDPALGDYSDATILYAEKMCALYDLPLVVYMTAIPTEKTVPVICAGINAWMITVIGFDRFDWKWWMGSSNSEDDKRMIQQFQEYRRILSQHYSDSLDGHGFDVASIIKTPEIRFPLEYMSKSELLAFIIQTDKRAYELLWTCGSPKATLKEEGEITGYLPCGRCKKCIEYKGAETRALEAVHRVAVGTTYLKTFGQEFKR